MSRMPGKVGILRVKRSLGESGSRKERKREKMIR
jgi:hypothetical protein